MDVDPERQASQVQLRCRKLVENLPGCVVFALDRELRVTFAGGRLVADTGFCPPSYVGCLAVEIAPPSLYAVVEPYLLATLRGEETSFEFDYPAGPSFTVRTTPLQEDENPATEILVIALDTTRGKRAEAAEREAQQALQQTTQAANLGLWDVNLQTNRVHYSHEWKQQLGYGDDEIGDSLDEWTCRLHPDDLARARVLARARALARAYLAAPVPSYEQEFRLRHKDGSYRWILARGTVYYDAAGKPAHALGVHIDITEKKQAEEALRASERQQRELAEALAAERDRLAAVLESLPVGVWISAQDGRVVAKNKQADLIWHGDAPLSSSVEEYQEYIAWDAVTGEQLTTADYPMARALRTGAPTAPCELRIRRFDGSEGTVLMSAVPLRDSQGQAAGVVGINVDISERKQAEDALRASEAALRRSQAVAHIGHWAADKRRKTMTWSDEMKRILGLDATSPSGNLDEVLRLAIHPHDLERVREWRAHLRAGRGAVSTEFRVFWPDGTTHTIWAAADEPERDDGGNVLRQTGIMQDITERKLRELEREQLSEQLQRQEQMAAVGQLAAGIAHDFNNIMSVILLYAELTSTALGLTDAERARVQTIVEQAQRAARMIRQILDFSRQAVYERRPLDLLPLLKEETKLLRQTLPENIDVQIEYVADEYLVFADPTRMQQLVMNLALNARDAMPDGGALHVGLGRVTVGPETRRPWAGMEDGNWVLIQVSDTGSGMVPELLDRIFEPFFTTKEPGGGSGLGLAQVQGIVAQHEGQITVASEPGAGTIFTVYLPAAAVPASAAIPHAETAPAPVLAQGHNECVLLVEDDTEVRGSLAALLEEWNYRVVQAANGQEALVCLARPWQQVDVILSDVVMPRLGGVGLVKALRKDGVTTPVILMSGYMAGDARMSLKGAGVIAWLDKPPSSAALAAALAAAVIGTSPT